MAQHHKEANHGSCDTLISFGIKHVKDSLRGVLDLKKNFCREIHTLKATQYHGQNLELDFSPFL